MKKSNIFLSVVLAAVLVVCLSSCDTIADTGKSPIPDSTLSAPFLGTYSYTDYYGNVGSWTFNNDGTGKIVFDYKNPNRNDSTSTFTYTYNSNKIYVTYSTGYSTYYYYAMSDSNNTLTLDYDGVYKK